MALVSLDDNAPLPPQSGPVEKLMSHLVRITRVTYSSAFENANYRAANGRAQAASLTVVCRPPAGPKGPR